MAGKISSLSVVSANVSRDRRENRSYRSTEIGIARHDRSRDRMSPDEVEAYVLIAIGKQLVRSQVSR